MPSARVFLLGVFCQLTLPFPLLSFSVCLFTWVMSHFLSLRLPQEVQARVPKLEVSGGRMGAQIVKRASLKRGKQ